MNEIATHRVSAAVLTIALEERDAYTRGHCDRVAVLVRELGEACRLSRKELRLLHLGALFHDIGKIGIPDNILLKRTPFTDEEWATMKSHSEKGERIVSSAGADMADDLAPIVRHHHEAFDGSGYPDGLCGEQIPLQARLLLVADAYDSMSTTRPYHAIRTHADVIGILDAESGRKFDPEVLKKFFHLIDKSPSRVN